MNAMQLDRPFATERDVRETRSSWTPEVRRQRARLARHKTQELLQLVSDSTSDSELWAVGAVAPDDLLRLVG